jgi:hypothetical protein
MTAHVVKCEISKVSMNFQWILHALFVYALSDQEIRSIITKHAPKVYFTLNEIWWPSSVNWHLDRCTREFRNGKWSLKSKQPVQNYEYLHPYYLGQSDLNQVPIYAYYIEKGTDLIDIAYYIFYPFNAGKDVLNTKFGNHVGDWEHITVRISNNTPSQLYWSAHDFGAAVSFTDGVEKYKDTHPIVYAARGSHGLWVSPGDHQYKNIVIATLVDQCQRGREWETWNFIEAFKMVNGKLDVVQGNRENTVLPLWMKLPENDGNQDARSGSIYRFGDDVEHGTFFGQSRIEPGPTGPILKNIWGSQLQ